MLSSKWSWRMVKCRTYISLLCGTCGTAVGRCYEAMEEGLQHLQSRFLLDTASIRRSAGVWVVLL